MLSLDDDKPEEYYYSNDDYLFDLAAKRALPENIIEQLNKKNEN